MRLISTIMTATLAAGTMLHLQAQNLISNSGFENSGTGWNLHVQPDFAATVSYPDSGAPEGTTYAQIHVTQVNVIDAFQDNWKVRLQFPEWETAQNGVYRLMFKARSTARQLKIGITKGAAGRYVDGYDIPLDTLWNTFTCTFISDTSGTGALHLNFYVGADTGVYEFDSVALEKTGEVTPTDNLIANGGFEFEGASWNLYVQSEAGAAANLNFVSDSAPEGTRFASVAIKLTSDPRQVQLQTSLFTVEEGATYAITYKARGTAEITVAAQYDQSNNYLVKDSKIQELTADWTTYSTEFVSDVSGFGALRFNFYLGGTAGTYDFDSVYVVKTGTTPLRMSSNRATQSHDLTLRKAVGGVLVSVPANAAQGNYSLLAYSPSGRLLGNRAIIKNNCREVMLPLKTGDGMVIIVFANRRGETIAKTWLVR